MSGLCHLCFCFAPWTAHNALCFKMTAALTKSTISFPGFSLLLRSNGHVSSNNTVVCGMPIFFSHHQDLATLASMFNQELSYVSSRFNANKLTVHHDRSKLIISHTRRKKINPLELNIFINHTLIAQVQKHKFLGIMIHENLSWKPHIATVCDKVVGDIGIFSKSRRYLPPVTLKTLCNYCNLIWASLYASYLKPLIYSKR